MKIGIMTLWGAYDNYGQQFQVYSLQHYLRNIGYDAYIIRYLYKNDIRKKRLYEYVYTIKYLFDISYVKNRMSKIVRKPVPEAINRGFDEFSKNYISFSNEIYRSIYELHNNPPEADVYIVGSDQVWNFSSQYKPYMNKVMAHFLDFGSPETKRIAYAVSFGRDHYGRSLRKFVMPLIQKFDYITCREEQGINICKSLGADPKLALDPVFLNRKEEYLKLINTINPLEREKYCLIYLLGNSTNISFEYIDKLAKENNVKIVFIPGKGLIQNRYENNYPNPLEWLWYMNNAEYIITNSFHGAVFSIILNKKFSVLTLSGKNSEMQNDRIYTMMKMLNISDNVYNMTKNPINITFDWKIINKTICHINEGIGLNKYLESIKENL